ncbi:MAG: hypothetical protein M5U19_22095 [Microthrixaceae bacterium]|nr:hypothetical protein [Microthrixaceae bacterium]
MRALIEDQPFGGIEPEAVASDILRGHLELRSPITAEALAALTGLKPSKVAIGLADLEASGFALQGCFTSEASDETPGGPMRQSGARGVCWRACTPTRGAIAAVRSNLSPPSNSFGSGCAGSTWHPDPS